MQTCTCLTTRLLCLLAGLTLLMLSPSSFAADAPPAGKKLVLKSDSKDGVWRFYPAAKPDPKLPRVLLVGDSIMNGYRGGVAKHLAGQATVDSWLTPITLKSPELYEDLRKVLQQGPYAVIHFNIGLHEWQKGLIPEGQYEPLLKAYVNIFREEAKGAKLIWASTTSISKSGKLTELDPENNPTIVERNTIAVKVMQDSGIPIDDLYGLMSNKLDLKRDIVHWTPKAIALQAEAVARIIAEQLPQQK